MRHFVFVFDSDSQCFLLKVNFILNWQSYLVMQVEGKHNTYAFSSCNVCHKFIHYVSLVPLKCHRAASRYGSYKKRKRFKFNCVWKRQEGNMFNLFAKFVVLWFSRGKALSYISRIKISKFNGLEKNALKQWEERKC